MQTEVVVASCVFSIIALSVGIAAIAVATQDSSNAVSNSFTPEEIQQLKQFVSISTITEGGALECPNGLISNGPITTSGPITSEGPITSGGPITGPSLVLPNNVLLDQNGVQVGEECFLTSSGLVLGPPAPTTFVASIDPQDEKSSSQTSFSAPDPVTAISITRGTNGELQLQAAVDASINCESSLTLVNVTTEERENLVADEGTLVYDVDLMQVMSYQSGIWVGFGTGVTGTAGQIVVMGNQIGLALVPAITPGTYTNVTAEVDAYGRFASVSSGPNPVVSITGTIDEIDVEGTATNPVLSLSDTILNIIESWNAIRPADSPTPANLQFLQYQASRLHWTQVGNGTFGTSRVVYVDKSGSNTTGNGTLSRPYATVQFAIAAITPNTSISNQTVICVAAGLYVEDNSVAPISITVNGLGIAGDSIRGTCIMPLDPTKHLFSCSNVSSAFANIRFESISGSSTASAFNLQGLFSTFFSNCYFRFFAQGLLATGTGSFLSTILVNSCFMIQNNVSIQATGLNVIATGSQFVSALTPVAAANMNAVLVSQNSTLCYLTACFIARCGYGVKSTDGCNTFIASCHFVKCIDAAINESQAHTSILGCDFTQMDAGHVAARCRDAGSQLQVNATTVDGRDIVGVSHGTGFVVSDTGHLAIQASNIRNCQVGIQVGSVNDLISTVCNVSDSSFSDNAVSIQQNGTSSLLASMISIDPSTITISDSTNVKMLLANTDANAGFLQIGNFSNADHIVLMEMLCKTDPTLYPRLCYRPSIYDADEAFGFHDVDPDIQGSSMYALSTQHSYLDVVTQNLNKQASLRLVSDTASEFGDNTAVRGWRIYKANTSSELQFAYRNDVDIGQPVVAETSLSTLDPVQHKWILGAGMKLQFEASDTVLERTGVGQLTTNATLILQGTITPNYVLYAGTNSEVKASNITITELNTLSGAVSSLQTQINGKMSNAGGTFSGVIQIPAGSILAPSLQLGSTSAGLYSAGPSSVEIVTANVERLSVDASGNVLLKAYTTPGLLRVSNSSGLLTASQLQNSDIPNATITNAKLATASAANNASYVVVRNTSGQIFVTNCYVSGPVLEDTQAATKEYVDTKVSTGLVYHDAVVAVSVGTNVPLTGSATVDSVELVTNDRVLLTSQTDAKQNGPWVVDTAGSWTRPSDFQDDTQAGGAYFLVTGGSTWLGSSWVCSTPNAEIGTDNIAMTQFATAQTITLTNVGTGTGSVFKDKSGNNYNLRTLRNTDGFILISNLTNDLRINANAASTNTASTLVARDASGHFSAGTITANLTGVASGNLPTTGGTLLGTVVFPAGTLDNPPIQFTGNDEGTGISSVTTDVVEIQILGVVRFSVSATGITMSHYGTGLLHSDGSGNLTSSAIVGSDIASNTIPDSKLQTLTTSGKVSNSATTATASNVANTILLRDSLGNTAVNELTAVQVVSTVIGSASLNLLKAGDTMTGTLILPAGTASSPGLVVGATGGVGLSNSSGTYQVSTNNVARLLIDPTGVVTIPNLLSGVVKASSGILTASSIRNADIASDAAIVDTKLATISTAGKVLNSATTATSFATASTLVERDIAGDFSANIITATLNGSASGNLPFSGGILTGPLQLAAGSAGAPSLRFTGSTSTGLSASVAHTLELQTAGVIRVTVSPTGVVSFLASAYTTSAGILHMAATTGDITNSLITNADVSASAGIVDTKLATIATAGKVSNSATTATSANTANAIVARNASGDFTAGTITANVTGTASGNLPNSGGTLTGALQVPAGSAGSPSLRFTSSVTTGLSASVVDTLEMQTAGSIRATISSTGVFSFVASSYTSAAGILHIAASTGNITNSLLVNADVSASAAIADTKLATLTTAGKVSNSATTATAANTANAIVARDASGDFSAGTITANLTGTASGNLPTSGGVLTGTLQLPAGASGAPSLRFTGSLTTGLSVSTTDLLELQTAGVIRATLSSTGVLSLLASAYTSAAGILHIAAGTGNVTNSLVVNADISASAAIADTKLATISTAGKVSNAATTATSANTANAIVARDASGNCVVSSVTAATSVVLGTTNAVTVTSNAGVATALSVPNLGTTMTAMQFQLVSHASSASLPVYVGTPATIALATISAAELATGTIVWSQAGASVALPTGASIAANADLAPFNVVGLIFEVLLLNARPSKNSLTITSNTNCTLASANCDLVIGGAARLLKFRASGGGVWVVY